MNPTTYSNLLACRPTLSPVPVPIEGLDSPLLIHTFSVADYSRVVEATEGDEEFRIRVQILRFLGGLNADVSAEAVDQLGSVFTPWQIRDIYLKAIRVNGQGPASVGDAAKK